MDDLSRRLLSGARDAIDAALELGARGGSGDESCSHPKESRVDMSAMGDEGAYYCRDCRGEFHPNRRDMTEPRELRGA